MAETYRELSKQLRVVWDNKEASYVYVLTHTVEMRGSYELTSHGLFRTKKTTEYGEWRTHTTEIERGDRAWAERIAEHHGLTLPGENTQ